jgi:hypothetical protein
VKVGDLVRVKSAFMPGPRTLEIKTWMLKLGIVIKNDTFHPTVQWSNGYCNKMAASRIEVVNESG